MKYGSVLIAAACASLAASAVQFEVKPLACYEVSYKARVVAGPCLEKSPQLAGIAPMCVSRANIAAVAFAGVQWRFKDAKGKVLPRPVEGASPQTLFSCEWTQYRYRFWTPEDAARFELEISPGKKGNRAEIADAAIAEVKDPSPLNFNGDFSAADDAAPGWQLIGSALFQNVAPGKSQVATMAGHVNCDLFLVPPGGTIRVDAECANPAVSGSRHTSTNVRLEFYRSYREAARKGARVGAFIEQPVTVSGNPGRASRRYRVPEGKRWARVSVWHGVARNISIVAEEGGVK